MWEKNPYSERGGSDALDCLLQALWDDLGFRCGRRHRRLKLRTKKFFSGLSMSFPKKGVVSVQGVDYVWSIERFGGVSNNTDQYRGLAVSVSLEPGRTKELFIEFPFEEFEFSPPKSKSAFTERLCGVIEAAMAEGWVPDKRGKTFYYEPPKA
jgi:hypothetical protein